MAPYSKLPFLVITLVVIIFAVCHGRECRSYQFKCNNGRQCIMETSKCDGWKSCDDGSDETTELCGTNCEKVRGGRFACNNGRCIREGDKCNGIKECDNGSDETTEAEASGTAST